MTPRSIREYRDSNGEWMARVFHDRAPLFLVEGGADRRAEGMFDRMNTVGAHEIVVETPVHGMTLAQLPEEHIAHVLELFRDRILDLKQDRRLRYVSVFKDQHAPSATLEGHAYSQVLGTPVLPQLLEIEFRWSRAHFLKRERCIYCDALQQELREEKRLVDQNEDFVAFCPFGSRWSYELWVAPVRHSSSFENDLTERGASGGARAVPQVVPPAHRKGLAIPSHGHPHRAEFSRRGSPPKSGGTPCGMIITGTSKFNRTLMGGGAFWAPRASTSTPFRRNRRRWFCGRSNPASNRHPQLKYGQTRDFRLETSSAVGL